jgi:hypothetical protein|tara:strand:- start:121 stop:420 length:300 start_codon:yes stop_codon:yes gene_type:complete
MGIIGNNQIVKSDNEQLLNAPYGMQGATLITDTNQQFGDWYCIVSVEDSTQLTMADCLVNWSENGGTPTTDLFLLTGVVYYGDWKSVTLAAGKVLAYTK